MVTSSGSVRVASWAFALSVVVSAVSMLGVVAPAKADEMDIVLSRLRTPALDGTDCAASLPGTGGSQRAYCAQDQNFRGLMTELGTTLAPSLLRGARTLGSNGFYFGFHTNVTSIGSDREYWQLGTLGNGSNPDQGNPTSTLSWSRLSVAKGLPFGVELGFNVARAYRTSYWAYGFFAQVAPFEGFRTGWGWLPDFAMRVSVQTLAGGGQFHLVVPALDFIVSKPITVAHSVRITPILGAQLLWAVASSEVIDLTPTVDAFLACMPETGAPAAGDVGTLRCAGSPDDFNNDVVFNSVRSRKARIELGLQLQYEHLVVSAAAHFDVGQPTDNVGSTESQWSVAAGLGLAY